MKLLSKTLLLFLFLPIVFTSCEKEDDPIQEPTEEPEVRVGFEILNMISFEDIRVWVTYEITQEEFDSIQLPQGWFKNQIREGEPNGSGFRRSPGSDVDGDLIEEEHFGHSWRHNAKVIDIDVALPSNEEGLLSARSIEKYHHIKYNAGRTLYVLVDPDGKEYVRVSRDLRRTSEESPLPEGWKMRQVTIQEELTFDLPNPTLNIRTSNEDSFQGPVEF